MQFRRPRRCDVITNQPQPNVSHTTVLSRRCGTGRPPLSWRWRAAVRAQFRRPIRERVAHAILDVFDQHALSRLRVAPKRAFEQLTVLARRDLAAENDRDYLIAQIFVLGRAMGVQMRFQTTGRYQRMVEFPIVPLPKVWCAAITCEHSAFNHRQLVMRRDNSPLPFHVAGREGERHRMALQELTEIGYLFEVFRRNW